MLHSVVNKKNRFFFFWKKTCFCFDFNEKTTTFFSNFLGKKWNMACICLSHQRCTLKISKLKI